LWARGILLKLMRPTGKRPPDYGDAEACGERRMPVECGASEEKSDA